MTKLFLPVFLIAIALNGCDCGRRGSVTQAYGEIGVVWTDQGAEIVNRDATYDFGSAVIGDRVPKQLIIRNLSSGLLNLQTLERTEGSPVTIGDQVADHASFEVGFTQRSVGVGEEITMDMYFTPQLGTDATQLSEQHMAKLLLTAGGTREDENSAVITLIGTGELGSCKLPKEIDFGGVPVGEKFQFPLTMKNDTTISVTAHAGPPESTTGDHLAFGYSDGSPRNDFPIAGGGSADVVFTFAPTEMRDYSATVTLQAGPQCPPGVVTLKGTGVDNVLTWTPTSLDYGFISPGTIATKQVLFTNLSNIPITLTQVKTSMPSDFQVRPEVGTDATTLTIPGGAKDLPMTVLAKPATLGARSATLTFQTGLTKIPTGTIDLKCFGGGPKIKTVPATDLAFGATPYFAGTNSSVTRRVTVMNVGTLPPNGDLNGNLHLGSVDANGPGQLPYIAVMPLNGTTAQNEFTVGVPSTYDAAKGLEAVVGKNAVDLQVRLTPQSVGLKEAELTIFSNDPTVPETKIRISADVQVMQPCQYTVTPGNLNFGLVTPPTFKDLPFVIKNTGSSVCNISGVDIAAGSDAAYSVVGGAIASKTLNANEELHVVVRSNPQTAPANNGTATLVGKVTFGVNAPGAQPFVQLSTSVGPSCLTIAPDVLDFGTVKKGCSSSTRTFNAYNTCSSDIYINGFTVSVPAGQPAGGPNCPGTSACGEFVMVSSPAIPTGGLRVPPGSAGVSFQAKYSPIDFGADSGAISVSAIQSGQPVTYLVSLSGTGDATGQQTDQFVQDSQPKADILLVIDSSSSMDDKQNQLANNFQSFMQYATAAGVDYHIGVTTTDMDSANCQFSICMPDGPKGKLLGDANNPKVLTPITPNVQTLYQQKVKVGTGGSGYEQGLAPAVAALTPPLITNENAGFLRQDARLAVVVVTDARDQSPDPVNYYLNRLLNVKGFNKASEFTFSVVGPFNPNGAPSGCTYDETPDNGRYAQMINSTSGVKGEICTSNWSQTLQSLGQTAFGYRTTFYLNAAPDLTGGRTIDVKIDGVTIPQTSGSTSNWTYDAAANAVNFNPTASPDPGQTLSITYFVACL